LLIAAWDKREMRERVSDAVTFMGRGYTGPLD
jgi:hypothetical protein